jgi:hypothetical protein
LSLPEGGHRYEVINTKALGHYFLGHIDSIFNWARKNKLGVERMEDLTLVTGCTRVTSWSATVVVDNTMEAEVSLGSRMLSNGGTSSTWSNNQGTVVHRNSRLDPVSSLDYVYSACTDFFFVVWKAKQAYDSGSMRLHQGITSKAH